MSFLDTLKGFFKSKPKSRLPIIDVSKRFELMGRTGQGSMSKVWRARDRRIGKIICLKVLDREKTAKFESRFAGLVRPTEGGVLAQLRHENVVRSFEHGMTREKEQYIVMELIEGMGLNFMVETRNAMLEANKVEILSQCASGLEYVHKQGFMHRDICPRNVMVTRDGVAKLIDFGLSIPYRPEFCRPGNRTGTPNYLAPELIKRQSTDHRVDMFALGVTAYEVYTGQLPWEKTESLATLLSHMNNPGKDPREIKRDMDEKTRRFLMKAVERDREKRFQNAAEFRDALQRLAQN